MNPQFALQKDRNKHSISQSIIHHHPPLRQHKFSPHYKTITLSRA
jgi:hypothetical protein